jgi:acylphosphatase
LVVAPPTMFSTDPRRTHRTFFTLGVDAKHVRIRARVIFEGIVQGVFFRANTKRCADSLGLTGWVTNRLDGSVEAIFEGEEDRVREAIEWCSTKQPYARVSRRSVETYPATGEFDGFFVR